MANSKIKIIGINKKERLDNLISQCVTNNQICFHIRRNEDILIFLKKFVNFNSSDAMILLYHYKENIKEIPKCSCGLNRKYHCYGYRESCGNIICVNIAREKSKKEYCLAHYGVEFVTQLESMKESSRETNLMLYGVDNITKLPEIILKRKKSNLQKWGVEDPISLSRIRGDDAERGFNRIQEGLPIGYNIKSVDGNYYILICPKQHSFEISKYMLSNKKNDNIEVCNQCNEYVGSRVEQEVFNYVSLIYDKNILRSNRRLIAPFEIDMILEDIKLCIEFNGDYWHSTKIVDNQFYHLNKLNMCLDKGYDLIQIKENDWYTKKEYIKKKIYDAIFNIIDISDYMIDENKYLVFDLSWYRSSILNYGKVIHTILPELIKVGQYEQWSCGFKLLKI